MKFVNSLFFAVIVAFTLTATGLIFARLLLFGHDQIGFSQIDFSNPALSSSWVITSADWGLTIFGVVTWLVLPLAFLASCRALINIVKNKEKPFDNIFSWSSIFLKLPLVTGAVLLAVLTSMKLPEMSQLPNGNGGVLGIILLSYIPTAVQNHLAFDLFLFVTTSILSFFAFPEIRYVSVTIANITSSLLIWVFAFEGKSNQPAEHGKYTEHDIPTENNQQFTIANPSDAMVNPQQGENKVKVVTDSDEKTSRIAPHKSDNASAKVSTPPSPATTPPIASKTSVESKQKGRSKTQWLYKAKKSTETAPVAKYQSAPTESIAFKNANVTEFRTALHTILAKPTEALSSLNSSQQLESAQALKNMLADFNLIMEIGEIITGPVVTRYEFQPPAGFKVAQLVSLTKDLARVLKVSRVRVVETISGKSTIGIELPNQHRLPVTLGGIIGSEQWQTLQKEYALPVVIGRTVEGNPMIVDIAGMPHLLVAGTTGSGKSVGVNSMLISALATYSPEELRLVLVDPKILEFSSFKGLPHLLCDVVTEMDKSDKVLEWCVTEMDRRYRKLADAGTRNIGQYNQRAAEGMPYLLIVIDEWADMMMATGKKSETLVVRLAQKARACGIHLILATQRPSVDVITGLMKSNIPARLCYQVASAIDSRTMLDSGGGELLLGKGDALIKKGGIDSTRVHGAFVTDEEIEQVVEYWQGQAHKYSELDTLSLDDLVEQVPPSDSENLASDLYQQAIDIARTADRVSISKIQRKLGIGFNRAANFVEQMEDEGLVSTPDNKGVRTYIG